MPCPFHPPWLDHSNPIQHPLLLVTEPWIHDNIKMNLKEVEMECVDWICLARDRSQLRAFVNR
jgi:hypothetical protein